MNSCLNEMFFCSFMTTKFIIYYEIIFEQSHLNFNSKHIYLMILLIGDVIYNNTIK